MTVHRARSHLAEDAHAGLMAAGDGDAIDALGIDEQGSGLFALDQVEHAGRQAGASAVSIRRAAASPDCGEGLNTADR
jgi:hypothetical protein